MTDRRGPGRVYLHIGLQKTGTSYLQSIFWASQDALRGQGLDLVPGSKRETFHLMLCMRERYDARLDPPEVAHALDRLPGRLAAAEGDRALVTEESLSSGTPDQVGRLVAACGDREVHVVVTVRDLARQLPSAWQQQLRAGGSVAFDDYVDRVVSRRGRQARRFWASHDLLDVLDRWEQHVPAERIHVVTVPQPGGPREALLERYCSVLGVDPATLAADAARGNTSLGRVQAELLRRVNAGLRPDQTVRQLYGDVGKRWFSIRVLGQQPGVRTLMPPGIRGWCEEQADAWVPRLEGGSYDVVGDAGELRPAASAFAEGDQAVTEAEVADAATAALVEVLGGRIDRLRARKQRARKQAARKAAGKAARRPGAGPVRSPRRLRRLARAAARRLARSPGRRGGPSWS